MSDCYRQQAELTPMQAIRYVSGSIRTMTWLDRVVVLMVALLLSLQLMVSGQHKDDHAGYGDNCPSCVFAHHVPSGLPEVNPVLLPVLAAQSYRLLRVVIHQAPLSVSFLIPKSQAPPRG
jgi:hypothetical protein